MAIMRRLLWIVLRALGLPAALRFLHRHHLTILLYHGVAPRVDRHIYNYRRKFITPEAFGRHLEYLSKRYAVLELDSALAKLREGTLPPRALVITFDDGYRNFYDYALPLLQKYGMPATIFVASDFVLRQKPLWVDRLEHAIGQMPRPLAERIALDSSLRDKLKTVGAQVRESELAALETTCSPLRDFTGERAVYAPLQPQMLTQMRAHGITIGAHTRSHPVLSTLSAQEARAEIAGSADELRGAAGAISCVFAYPNGQRGDYTGETIDIIKKAGFAWALTTIEGTVRKDDSPYELRRITLDSVEDNSLLAAAVSGLRGLVRATKSYG